MTLIERLEKAGEGSRELDAEIATAMGWTVHNARRNGLWVIPFGEYETCDPDAMFRLGEFTTSLDAALALAERTGLRPYMADATIKGRWRWMLENPPLLGDLEAEPWTNGVAATPALALCLAVLRATQEQPNV